MSENANEPTQFAPGDDPKWRPANATIHGTDGGGNTALEILSISDAAAECGVSVDTLIGWLVRDGMLMEHPDGGYVASPHPDLVELI